MMDGGSLLKPALSRGTLRCIGASSPDKFKKTIEKDPALERRFQQVGGLCVGRGAVGARGNASEGGGDAYGVGGSALERRFQ